MKKLLFIMVLLFGCASYPPVDLDNFLTEDRRLIESNRIRVGMTEQALLASWGRPGEYRHELKGWILSDIREHASRYVASKTYVYKNSGYFTNQYKMVYVSGGQITGWSK